MHWSFLQITQAQLLLEKLWGVGWEKGPHNYCEDAEAPQGIKEAAKGGWCSEGQAAVIGRTTHRGSNCTPVQACLRSLHGHGNSACPVLLMGSTQRTNGDPTLFCRPYQASFLHSSLYVGSSVSVRSPSPQLP